MSDRHDKLEALKKNKPDAWHSLVMDLKYTFLPCEFGDQLNHADREDFTQQTVLKILPKIQRIKTWKYILTVARRLAVRHILKRKRESIVPTDEIADGVSDDPEFDHYAASYANLCQEAFKYDEAKRDAKDRLAEKRALLQKKESKIVDQYAVFDAEHPDEKTPRKTFAESIGSTEGSVNIEFWRIRARLNKSGQKPESSQKPESGQKPE